MADRIEGEPKRGHKVDLVHAAVLVYADGSEGMFSVYAASDPVGRFTFVTSNPMGMELDMLKEAVATFDLPEGAHIEWREYVRKDANASRG